MYKNITTVLAIVGSQNPYSFTLATVKKLFEHDALKCYKKEIIALKDFNISDCIGCECCFQEGYCPLDQHDNFNVIVDKMKAADVILFASPIYLYTMPGSFKTFFDRLSRGIHTMFFAGKLSFSLITTRASGIKYLQEYMEILMHYLGMKQLGTFAYSKATREWDRFIERTAVSIAKEIENCNCYFNAGLEKNYNYQRELYTAPDIAKKKGYEIEFWNQNWVNECSSFQEFALKNRINLGLCTNGLQDHTTLLPTLYSNSDINLSEGTLERIQKYFTFYLDIFLNGKMSKIYYPDLLFVINSLYPYFENKAPWESLGYEICCMLAKDLEDKGYASLGMFGGLGYTTLLINEYSANTGHLQNLSNEISNFLLEQAVKFTKQVQTFNSTHSNYYDVIRGLSGIVYYLMDLNLKDHEQIESIISYLIGLSGYHRYKEENVLNYHIPASNQFREDEKIKFPDGNFNFGISHGMMGPLIALSKAYYKNYKTPGLINAIREILKIYNQFKSYQHSIPVWPTQLAYDDYIRGTFANDTRIPRASWCYGNISIARGLQKVGHYIGDTDLYNSSTTDLYAILEQQPKDYNLQLPTVCHGYSSVITIRMAAYREKKDEQLLRGLESDLDALWISLLRDCTSSSTEEIIHNVFENDLSFLQGAAGVALTLLGILKDNLTYNQLLMMD